MTQVSVGLARVVTFEYECKSLTFDSEPSRVTGFLVRGWNTLSALVSEAYYNHPRALWSKILMPSDRVAKELFFDIFFTHVLELEVFLNNF